MRACVKPGGVKTLRFKIKNELGDAEYKGLIDFFEDNPSVSIELFPSVDLEFASVNFVTVAVEGSGYEIAAEILFEQPIGSEVYAGLKLDDETHVSVAVNHRNLRLSKIVVERVDLENDLNMILKIVERIVNHTCIRFNRLVEQTFTLNSEWLDRQFNVILEREELEKRGEIPRPFGTMHALLDVT